MAATNGEILAVLDAVTRYLSIDLPCQSLTPDAQMGREDLLLKVEHLMNRINTSAPITTGTDAVDLSVVADSKRMSSYMDMTQFQFNSSDKGAASSQQEITDGLAANGAISINEHDQRKFGEDSDDQTERIEEEDTYEIAEPDHFSENSGGSTEEMNGEEEEDITEFTDDELLKKLKGLEHTSPKLILEGSICSGYTMKQKKKIISTWKKRFCIVKDCFLFYYKSEKDARALGVIVLPGYKLQIDEVASKCNKFIFKLFPTSRGRSTYLFQLTNLKELEMWQRVLVPICSKQLNRLKSDVFNRVARQLDEKADSEEGSAGEPVEPIVIPAGDLYEPIPEDGLHSALAMSPSLPICVEGGLYDDHVGVGVSQIVQPYADEQDCCYEGIPGDVPYLQSSGPEPIQEDDIYEDIPAAQNIPPRPTNIIIPPSPHFTTAPAPVLPPRTPSLPPRPGPARPGNEEVPLPPMIPIRKPLTEETVELIEEECEEEVSTGPSEADFSYEHVYIGTANCQANEADELAFNRGDVIYILSKVDPHWWIGYLGEKVGLVPSELMIAGFAH